MAPNHQLIIYCLLILIASLVGGWIPSVCRLTHTRVQLATSFVAGLMLGVAVLHLLPHAFYQVKSMDRVAFWLLVGFLVMFLVQRFLHFHEHEIPDAEATGAGAESSGNHGHSHPHPPGGDDRLVTPSRPFSWVGAAFGLTLHTLVNGIALAASVEADAQAPGVRILFGLSTFLVIVLHKPFDAMVIATLMRTGGWSFAYRNVVNAIFALMIPVGVILFHFGAAGYSSSYEAYVGCALAFSAGTFLCISTSDLLPELHFHEHDRVKLSISLLAGLLLAVGIGGLESSGHDHHDEASTPPLEASGDHPDGGDPLSHSDHDHD